MANGAQLILDAANRAIQAQTPVTNLLQGVRAGQGIQRNLLAQRAAEQQLGQQQALAPLEQQLVGQQIQEGDLAIQQRQAALDALGVPDVPTAKQVAFNTAKIAALPSLDQKLNQIQEMKQTAISQGRTTENLDELESAFNTSEQAGDELLNAGIQAFQQTGLLTPQEEITARADAQIAKAEEAAEKKTANQLKAELKAEETVFDRSTKLRGELSKASSEFDKVDSAFGRVEASIEAPSAAGDLALIFNFMKMLDPGSVVREGEFATAQNAAGVPERVRNTYANLLSGERLSDKQRQDFVSQARRLFKRSEADNKKDVEKIVSIGKQFGVSRENILGSAVEEVPPPETAPQATRIRFDAQGNIIQ